MRPLDQLEPAAEFADDERRSRARARRGCTCAPPRSSMTFCDFKAQRDGEATTAMLGRDAERLDPRTPCSAGSNHAKQHAPSRPECHRRQRRQGQRSIGQRAPRTEPYAASVNKFSASVSTTFVDNVIDNGFHAARYTSTLAAVSTGHGPRVRRRRHDDGVRRARPDVEQHPDHRLPSTVQPGTRRRRERVRRRRPHAVIRAFSSVPAATSPERRRCRHLSLGRSVLPSRGPRKPNMEPSSSMATTTEQRARAVTTPTPARPDASPRATSGWRAAASRPGHRFRQAHLHRCSVTRPSPTRYRVRRA